MISPSLVNVVLSGPKTADGLLILARLAAMLRAAGHVVVTPIEAARRAGATWGSIAYAREVAQTILDADAVLFAPGWEECDHALACELQADALRLPVYEYVPEFRDFVAVA